MSARQQYVAPFIAGTNLEFGHRILANGLASIRNVINIQVICRLSWVEEESRGYKQVVESFSGNGVEWHAHKVIPNESSTASLAGVYIGSDSEQEECRRR